jgi:hypothetical protein
MKVTETIEKEFQPDRIALTRISDGKFRVGFFEERDYLNFGGEQFMERHSKDFDNLSDACNYFSLYLKELEK